MSPDARAEIELTLVDRMDPDTVNVEELDQRGEVALVPAKPVPTPDDHMPHLPGSTI